MDRNQTGGELDNLTKTYDYDELSDVAKLRALEALHDRFHPDHGWWDPAYDSIEEFFKFLSAGQSVKIQGFDTDGSWICWGASIEITDEALDNLANNYGGDAVQEIVQFMRELLALYKLSKTTLGVEGNELWVDYEDTHTHERVFISSSVFSYTEECNLSDTLYLKLVELKDKFTDLFLTWLGDEYDYITSDEYMIEMAECNDVKFDEEGLIARD